jgi:hypothetical protein
MEASQRVPPRHRRHAPLQLVFFFLSFSLLRIGAMGTGVVRFLFFFPLVSAVGFMKSDSEISDK